MLPRQLTPGSDLFNYPISSSTKPSLIFTPPTQEHGRKKTQYSLKSPRFHQNPTSSFQATQMLNAKQ
jgi:hypothetical protein